MTRLTHIIRESLEGANVGLAWADCLIGGNTTLRQRATSAIARGLGHAVYFALRVVS